MFHKNCIYNLYHFSTLMRQRLLKSFLISDKNLPISHSQYHGCWCPGGARSQNTSNHDIDCVEPKKIGPCTLMFNKQQRWERLHNSLYFLNKIDVMFSNLFILISMKTSDLHLISPLQINKIDVLFNNKSDVSMFMPTSTKTSHNWPFTNVAGWPVEFPRKGPIMWK